MSDQDGPGPQTGSNEPPSSKRFGILCCVDGSDESFKALHYAVRIGSGTDADMTLMFVRPVDQGLRTGGLQLSLARENMLDWGLELPGTKALKKARDMLVELGWLDEAWEHEFTNVAVGGDPLGDNITVYTSEKGRSISLKHIVAPSISEGILAEAAAGKYDLTILPSSGTDDAVGPGFIQPDVAHDVAEAHTGMVLVTRMLEESHGHMVCVRNNEASINAARRDAEIAIRCSCPVYLFSAAETEDDLPDSKKAISAAKQALSEAGIEVSGDKVVVGDPVTSIVEEGKKYSVIVLSRTTSRTGWRAFLSTSVVSQVLDKAHNSVMVVR